MKIIDLEMPVSAICQILLLTMLFVACESPTVQQSVSYKGPLKESDNVEMIMTDSARLSVRMTAPKQYELQTLDQYFPKGINIEFYSKQGAKTTTLRANRGVQYRASNVHTAVGNVVVVNLEKKQTLKTEKLNWNPNTQKLYTDRFVTIITPNEQITGTGLEANQDFSSYKLRTPSGVVSVEK